MKHSKLLTTCLVALLLGLTLVLPPVQAAPNPYWADGFSLPGLNYVACAVARDNNGNLYIGGNFTAAGGISANRIARWDGRNWSTLGSGFDDTVIALALDDNGNLYAGGRFTTAGGVSANHIARWDGSSWSALGSGADGYVWSLAFDSNGTLYAGGTFTTAGGVSASRIARWDGSSWSALGSGLNGTVNALAMDSSSNIYAGGYFTTAGGTSANRIARWDGNSWSALGSGVNSEVKTLEFDGNGNIYAGGYFTTAGGISANRIARWDGSSWSALGSGVSGNYVLDLVVDGSGNLYAGGRFTAAGEVSANYIARWDGNSWSALGSGTDGDVITLALDGNGNLYASGPFNTIGGIRANHIARWDGNSWNVIGNGVDWDITSLITDGRDNLYARGGFFYTGGVSAMYLARWDGRSWNALSGVVDSVSDLTIDSSDNLYVGGNFTTAGGVGAKYIARWDGSSWSDIGSGLDSSVTSLAMDRNSGNLYAAGYFDTANGVNVNHIARWDGMNWNALGNGFFYTSMVKDLVVDGNGSLYAGGDYIYGGHIARWNGSNWTEVGGGTNSTVNALALDGNGNLYAGGLFLSAGGISARRVARWDGHSWNALDSGLNGNVNALAVDRSGNLYAGGTFTTAGGINANYIARWNGSRWNALGSGMNGSVNALAVDSKGNLYAGGKFTTADGKSSHYIAVWIPLDIQIYGNNQPINDGDTTPSLTDHTDFGGVGFGQAVTRTFTVSNTGLYDLTLAGSPLVTVTGPAALDFSLVVSPTTPIVAGGDTTFQVRFAPTVMGTRVATLTLANNNPDKSTYDFAIQGTGGIPNLMLSQNVAPTVAQPGQPITYTLAFANIGTGLANGVVITDTIPVSITNVSVISSGAAITNTGYSPAYVWNIENLLPGEGGVITLTGQVSPTLIKSDRFTNTAVITGTDEETDTADNKAAVGLDILLPTLTFDRSAYDVGEAVNQAVITLSLSSALKTSASIHVSSNNGTATADSDYTAINQNVTIPAGRTAITFTASISDDMFDENDETIILTLQNPAAVQLGTPHTTVLTITDDDSAGVVISPTNLIIGEQADNDTFTIRLTSQPTATVTVTLASTDTTECTVPPATNILPMEWQTGVTITVNVVDDFVDDGPQSCNIILTTASSDSVYDNLVITNVTMIVNDDDEAGIQVSPTTGLTTTEAGGTAAFTVWLDSQPIVPITVTLTSDVPTEGMVIPNVLTFTETTWNISQTVTIIGTNDDVVDGNQNYTIQTTPASNSEGWYNGLAPVSVSVVNLDDDTAGFNLNPTNLTINEFGRMAVFTLTLRSQPTAVITVVLSSSNPDKCSVTSSPVVLTAFTWQRGVSATVFAVDNDLIYDDPSCTVSGIFSSSDDNYNTQSFYLPVSLPVKEDDAGNIYLPIILKS